MTDADRIAAIVRKAEANCCTVTVDEIRWLADRAAVDPFVAVGSAIGAELPAPLTRDAARRFFRIESNGPTWWTVSPTQAHAWIQWATWHIDTGCADETDSDPTMIELTAEQAAAVRVSDDPTGASNLAALEMGATICTEY